MQQAHRIGKMAGQRLIETLCKFSRRMCFPSYVIENIGLRTAIDVVVYYNTKKDEKEWIKYKNLYAMPPGEKYVTDINSAQHLCAIYQSISGKNHYSYMAGSKLKYFDDKKGKKDFKEEYEIVKSAISK